MASDSSEHTRRKHHRSSSPVADADVDRSKRHKHKHHRRHKHHHHRSRKDKEETTVEEKVMEIDAIREDGGDLVVSNGAVDYDMEEGEILDDRVDLNVEKGKNLDSDVESGEIKMVDSNMVPNDENVETVDRKSVKLEKETGVGKKERATGSRDEIMKESSHGKASRSPDRSRRSRSRSVMKEDPYYLERKHRNDYKDERMVGRERNHRHSSRDYVRDIERERSSSRYPERTDRYHDTDTRERYRESSRERDRERDRLRERERDRETERDRNRDGVRMERNTDRDRARSRDIDRARSRDRDRGRDYESDRFSRRQEYGNHYANGDKERENDSHHRRNSENHHRDGSKRTDNENLSSKSDLKEKSDENLEREDEIQEDYQERISMQLANQEEDDVERIKEESRRRRQAILEKYKNKQKNEVQPQDTVKEKTEQLMEHLPGVEVNVEKTNSHVDSENGDVTEAPSFTIGKSPSQNGLPGPERPTGTGGLGEGTPKSERSDDMFRDDIFGESPAEARKSGKAGAVAVEKSGVNDNWDDAEGYYGYRIGEVLDGRYEILAAHGKGVFSTVVRAKDLKAAPGQPEEVAIKMIRNNETMYKAGMDELVILNKLVGADPENKRHCVRYLSNFKYRNHLCLVFESLHMNLREVLKKFGRNIGLKLTAVRTYAKQLLIALKHLKNCGVLHCDIKPDNMLVNEAKNVLKLCDFGNAMFSGRNEITPYLVSRFYRAPEIILGLPYDHPMDIWSVGCCLFELYSGKVLFPGVTNNDMLRLHMELKGPFPKKMLRKGGFVDQHFDQDLNFLATEEDPVTKKVIRRPTMNIKPKDFGSLILGSPGEDPKMASHFKDLMEKIFALDPEKRLTVSQALSHPFITGK